MTSKREELKNQLAQTAGNQVQEKPRTPSQLVADYLKGMMPAIQSVLPKHVTADRMSRIALNVIRTNPKLLACDINSLMGGVMEAAKLGLEPGLMGQCYLIPFENRKAGRVEAQFIIGYKGLIDLVRRSGQVSTIEARTVFENDEFDYSYGLDDKLTHKPALKDKGAPIAYYAIAKMKDGGYSFLVMSHQEAEQYRDKYAKSKNYGPWKDEFDAMARKSVLRQLIKYLPISVENLSNFDEASGSDIHQEMETARVIDMGEYVPTVDVDMNTGEIMEDNKNDE
jgi:recombination protein RecT